MKVNLYMLLICILITTSVLGQEISNQHIISAGINADSFSGLEFGYAQPSDFGKFPVLYYVALNIPIINTVKQNRLDTWEFKFGAEIETFRRDNFLLMSDISLFIITHQQVLGRFIPAGYNIRFTPAYPTKNGYIGAQLKYNQVMFTHIKHSDYVKDRFSGIYDSNGELLNMQPQDGLYSLTGNHLGYGIEGKFRLNSRLDLFFDLGIIDYLSKYTKGFDAMMYGQVPFYVDVRIDYKLHSYRGL